MARASIPELQLLTARSRSKSTMTIYQACKAHDGNHFLESTNYPFFFAVTEAWVEIGIPIPTPDFEHLVEGLPNTNKLLKKAIESKVQSNQVHYLPAKVALDWLQKTARLSYAKYILLMARTSYTTISQG